MPLLRSRQPKSENGGGNTTNSLLIPHSDEEANKGNTKSFFERNKAQVTIILSVILCCIFLTIKANIINTNNVTSLSLSIDGANEDNNMNQDNKSNQDQNIQLAPMGSIIYGAKGKGGDTAKLVNGAIQSGFRHIATVCA